MQEYITSVDVSPFYHVISGRFLIAVAFEVHSGCAISGLVWLIAFTAQATKEFVQKGKVSYEASDGDPY